jgi:hypothetical protein
MQIARNDEHSANAELPRTDSVEPLSNVTADIVTQFSKQDLQIIVTERGTQIRSSKAHVENAASPRAET